MRTAPSSRDQSQLEGRSALRVGFVVATLAIGALASGCGADRDLRGSMRAYETGNFRRAEERCENIDEAELQGKVQVRFLVYCGLAYYKVGRQDAAREFLVNGRKLYTNGDPSWLKPLIVDEMNKAILNLSAAPVGPASYSSAPVGRVADGKSAGDSDYE